MKKNKKQEVKSGRKKGRLSFWRVSAVAIGVILAFWGILPYVFHRIGNIGVWVPVAVGTVLTAWGLRQPPKKKRKGWHRSMMTALVILIGCVVLLACVLSAMMAAAALKKPMQEEATVIVLGAKINDRSPSLMLKGRLDAAYDYLKTHPEAMCVVSGGQGIDEICSEAEAMADYLMEKGIAAERLLLENQSTNTYENLQFSMELIREQGLSENVVIATQEFHQYRAATLAKWAGASDVAALTCLSPLHLFLCYWVRECAAICRLFILKY